MRNAYLAWLVIGLIGSSLGLGTGYLIFKMQNMEFQLEEARDNSQQMSQEIKNLQNNERKLLAEKDALESDISKLVNRLDRLNETLVASRRENQDVGRQISELRLTLVDVTKGQLAQIEELRILIKNRDSQLVNVTKLLVQVHGSVANLTRQTQTLQSRIVNMTKKISDLELQLGALRDQQTGPPRQDTVYAQVHAYNFDSQTVGNLPANWSVIRGSWAVTVDDLAPSPKLSYKQSLRTSGTNYLTVENENYDFTKGIRMNWKMKTLNSAGSGWARFGMVFLYQDPSNYYAVTRDDNGRDNNYLHVIKVVNGVETDLKRLNPGGSTTGTWRTYDVTLLVSGSQVSIKLNLDRVIDQVLDTTPWRIGKVGLVSVSFAPSTADAVFDDVVISYGAIQPVIPGDQQNPRATCSPGDIVFQDDFEYADSITNHGWNALSVSGSPQTQSDVVAQGSRALKIDDPSSSLRNTYFHMFPVLDRNFQVDFYLRAGQFGIPVLLQLQGNAGDVDGQGKGLATELSDDVNRSFRVQNTYYFPYQLNKWYHVRLTVTPSLHSFDTYVEDMSNPLTKDMKFLDTSFDRILIWTGTAGIGSGYWDGLVIRCLP